MSSNECIVKGCKNRKNQGQFVYDICQPCHTHITTGEIGYTDSFLGKMFNDIIFLTRENFMLAAGQCVDKRGVLGDDHGHSFCPKDLDKQ